MLPHGRGNKKPPGRSLTVFYSLTELALDRSADGANTSASTTFDASISVDDELAVTLSDSGNRAFTCASAASDALIVDYVCHSVTHLLADSVTILSAFMQKSKCLAEKFKYFRKN